MGSILFTDRLTKALMIFVLLVLIQVWIIPVLGSGTDDELIGYWTGTHDNHPTELIFTQDGSGISGVIKVLDLNEEDEITDITFDGNQISFYRPFADERFTGIYQDGKLYGSYTWHGQTGSMWSVSPDLEKNKDYSTDYSDPSSNYDIVVDDSILLTTWSGEHDKHPTELIFTKEGDALKGTIKVLDLKEEDELTDITFDGQTISFYRPFADEQFTGVFQDNLLSGTYTYQGGAGSTWSVRPKPGKMNNNYQVESSKTKKNVQNPKFIEKKPDALDWSNLDNVYIDYTVGDTSGMKDTYQPAGITYQEDMGSLVGTWSGEHDGRPTELIFTQDGSQLKGTIRVLDLKEEDEITQISLDGTTITFYRPFADERFTGTITGDKMSGTYTYQGGQGSTWTVTKQDRLPTLTGTTGTMDIAGVWYGTFFNNPTEILFTKTDSGYTGIFRDMDGNKEYPLYDISVNGDQISFKREWDMVVAGTTNEFTGTIEWQSNYASPRMSGNGWELLKTDINHIHNMAGVWEGGNKICVFSTPNHKCTHDYCEITFILQMQDMGLPDSLSEKGSLKWINDADTQTHEITNVKFDDFNIEFTLPDTHTIFKGKYSLETDSFSGIFPEISSDSTEFTRKANKEYLDVYSTLGNIWTVKEGEWAETWLRDGNFFYAMMVKNKDERVATKITIISAINRNDNPSIVDFILHREDTDSDYVGSFDSNSRMVTMQGKYPSGDVNLGAYVHKDTVDPKEYLSSDYYLWTISDGRWAGTFFQYRMEITAEYFDGNNIVQDEIHRTNPSTEKIQVYGRKTVPGRVLTATSIEPLIIDETENGQLISHWEGSCWNIGWWKGWYKDGFS